MNDYDFTLLLTTLRPEIALGLGACFCLALGLAPQLALRKAAGLIAAISLAVAGLLVYQTGNLSLTNYVKLATAGVGLLLLLLAVGVPGTLAQVRNIDEGRQPFEPGQVLRGEFLAFFLLSLMGVMLTAGAGDLVWLFLTLELTSLPTYVMVALSRDRAQAQEAAVKYFFLGAASAAIFLYGFAMLYGATGSTELAKIAAIGNSAHRTGAPLPPLFVLGLVLSVVGISFKIAAVPMHFYVADVYQGAASPVSAFLAFVPKTAGFVALILILDTVGWPLPPALSWTLWAVAVLTMTIGNVLGLLQTNVKRVLAYSSIAHSGYMLVALLAGPVAFSGTAADSVLGSGTAAILFYLVVYALANMAAFGVLACLRTGSDEAQDFAHLSGLVRTQPALAAIMLLAVLSLIGLPPLAGFLGKIYLFGAAVSRSGQNPEYLWLVVIAVINSAISAVYYLRIAAACFFGPPAADVQAVPARACRYGATIAAAAVLALNFWGAWLIQAAAHAARSKF